MFKKLKSNPKYGVVILLMLFLGIALPDFGQFQVSSLADKLRAAMDLSQSQYSTIATAPLLAGIIFGFLSGVLMDRFGMRVLFPYAALFVALSFLTMVFVHHGDSRPEEKKGLEAFEEMDD